MSKLDEGVKGRRVGKEEGRRNQARQQARKHLV